MKKIILMCLLTLTLVACGSRSNDKSAACTYKQDETNVAKVTTTKSDDKLSKIVMDINGELGKELFEMYEKEELEKLLIEQLVGDLEGNDGITSSIDLDDKKYTYEIKITIDPSKMNKEQLEEMDISKLDADAFVKQLSDGGYDCGDFK